MCFHGETLMSFILIRHFDNCFTLYRNRCFIYILLAMVVPHVVVSVRAEDPPPASENLGDPAIQASLEAVLKADKLSIPGESRQERFERMDKALAPIRLAASVDRLRLFRELLRFEERKLNSLISEEEKEQVQHFSIGIAGQVAMVDSLGAIKVLAPLLPGPDDRSDSRRIVNWMDIAMKNLGERDSSRILEGLDQASVDRLVAYQMHRSPEDGLKVAIVKNMEQLSPLRREMFLTLHLLEDAIWRRQNGYEEDYLLLSQSLVPRIKEMMKSEFWWARLFAVEFAKRHKLFLAEVLGEMGDDDNGFVRRAVAR